MIKTFSLSNAPRSRVSEQWEWIVTNAYHPLDVSDMNSSSFDGFINKTKVGDLEVTEFQSGQHKLNRTHRHINNAKDDSIIIVLPTRGICHVEQAGRKGVVSFGNAAVLRSTSPYCMSCTKDFANYSLQLPYNRIASRVSNIDTLCGHALKLNSRAHSFLQQALQSLLDNGAKYEDCAILDQKVAGYIVDLCVSSIDDAFNINSTPSGSEHQQQLRKQICSYILDNLENPRLDPASIAKENNLSVSYLHKLFKAENISVTRWVLQKRLERSREKLLCPTHRQLSISRIAFACGFNSLAHFSTRFKDHFGVSPRKLRAMDHAPSDCAGNEPLVAQEVVFS